MLHCEVIGAPPIVGSSLRPLPSVPTTYALDAKTAGTTPDADAPAAESTKETCKLSGAHVPVPRDCPVASFTLFVPSRFETQSSDLPGPSNVMYITRFPSGEMVGVFASSEVMSVDSLE